MISSPWQQENAWFTYYYWMDDARRPRLRPSCRYPPQAGIRPGGAADRSGACALPALQVGWKLAKKTLGFRYLMDVIPLDASLVKGSHGRPSDRRDDHGPLLITQQPDLLSSDRLRSVDVAGTILAHLR